jgi:tetratricopeptide (TPR) repeat protein
MMKPGIAPAVCALVLTLFLAGNAHGATLKESWYMSRGKANMEIKNYSAAIEAFEKLVALNPDNREAMRLLGQAYELQGLTDKAIEHYDRYLNRFPDDAEIAFKQAEYLEGERFSYRKKDAIRYYRMGLKVRPQDEYRHRLAKLLAGDKSTIDESVTEYKILIEHKPHDPVIRAEYRTLILWDDRYLADAVQEYEKAARENPDQFEIQHQLARLYYKDARYTQKAIQQYARLVAVQPDNVMLRTEYAKALAKSDLHFDQANKQFLIVLKQRSDYSTRLAYADHLAKQAATRDEALAQYAQLVRAKPDDRDVRLKYARLLGAHIETIDRGIEQYQILIGQDPTDSAAHRGLAAAYAWRGDNDRAIYHSKLALRYDSQDRTANRLKDDLMQGREPRITAGLTYLNQTGDDSHYDYDGLVLKAGGKADITPFVTGFAEIGLERYHNDEADVDGTFYQLGLQGRFDPAHRIDAEWKYHDFGDTGDGNEFLVQYSFQSGNFLFAPGIKREVKYDSLQAIAGATDEVSHRKIGAARANTAFCRFAFQGKRLQASATPYWGFVSAQSSDDNALYGADADARFHTVDNGAFAFAALYKLHIYHFDEDHSGFVDRNEEPFAGGYFSPDLFADNTLLLEFSYQVHKETELRLGAGPSIQYNREHSSDSAWYTGAELNLACHTQISPSLYLTAEGYYFQIADVYRKYALTAMIAYRF